MKITFGDIEIKVPYEKYVLQKISSMENPFESMFSKSNQELFIDFFKKTQSSFAHNFEEYKKWLEKFSETNKSEKSEG